MCPETTLIKSGLAVLYSLHPLGHSSRWQSICSCNLQRSNPPRLLWSFSFLQSSVCFSHDSTCVLHLAPPAYRLLVNQKYNRNEIRLQWQTGFISSRCVRQRILGNLESTYSLLSQGKFGLKGKFLYPGNFGGSALRIFKIQGK